MADLFRPLWNAWLSGYPLPLLASVQLEVMHKGMQIINYAVLKDLTWLIAEI